ncbi:hypothetical protein ACFMQL_10165 [Nonomuraea fastidiosa]|jgi:hypothetical protein|uniref:hypothetical protein n=1 Tax=Nonomuraea TaxID=83681 RepID=UPI00324FC5DE
MLQYARRVLHDIRERRNIEAYVISLLAIVFAALTLIGDKVDDQLKWAVLLAGVGVLVHQITVPRNEGALTDRVLEDRTGFERVSLKDRLRTSQEIWMFAPSGVNFLSEDHCGAIRSTVLNRHDGSVKMVVLDHEESEAVRIATQQLDNGLEYPLQTLADSIVTTRSRMAAMASWPLPGGREFRLFGYNPGFSLVAFNPTRPDGVIIVEIHGVRNSSTSGRMHLELTKKNAPYWYTYWLDQFNAIWNAAKPLPLPPKAPAGNLD